ncbi:histidine phosphatase family protein [Polaribacter aestuariivivens]|uniref:Histidine phosphatase family protein n=1 Tax=Polaribacter aestuariivivens TaxID=2304626 RepID=A0A5S3NCB6_9FLAO|nr:phosphoglycerate mutase family protein [Polaribacter aestuariivivens]TMM31279.1 histidine phosphatase family protein [Polaribacter aestuariivivens]
MKKFLFLFVFAFGLLSSCNSQETTTYYLIRHAEKDRTDKTNRNPELNEDGLKRAQNWVNYFENINLDAVYSTNYNRTIQTATPTATSKGLQVLKYDPRNMYSDDFAEETKGKTVLIVGHSNTTPAFANKILDENKYEDLFDNDNSSLFIVTIKGDEIKSEVKKIE